MEHGKGTLEKLVVNPEFWRGRRVLVTGHSGFKGCWLSLWLESMGAEVIGYSATAPTKPSLFELARLEDSVRSIKGDIRDPERLLKVFRQTRPEIVIHMAAQALVRRSYRDPVETYETNVMGTVNLLEAVRRSEQVRAVINVTTDKVYENHESESGYREDEPKGGHDPYSNSKACSELVTAAYRDSIFTSGSEGPLPAVATARAGNVIGGGDWGEDRLIPDIMRGALDGDLVPIRNPEAIRPWQYVLNPLSGYLRLAEALSDSNEYADGWNFGPDVGDVRPVRWIIERLTELWGEEIKWEHDTRSHPHETFDLRLDSSKARTRLGWSPTWDLDEALGNIVVWYKGLRAGESARELTLHQIEAFQSRSRSAAGV